MKKMVLTFACFALIILLMVPNVSAASLLDLIIKPAPNPSGTVPTGTWVGSVRQSPQGPLPAGCGTKPSGVFLFDKQLSMQTMRSYLRSTTDGNSLRVRFSNMSGTQVKIDKATVALSSGWRSIDANTLRQLKFYGNTSVTMAPYTEVQSDVVGLPVSVTRDLAISTYVAGASQITWHGQSTQPTFVTGIGLGDRTTEASGSSFTKTTYGQYLVSGIDVFSQRSTSSVVVIGDSITDGGLGRWPDTLNQRLREDGQSVSVVNSGLACNQLTRQGDGMISGEARFDRDVLNVVGGKQVVIFMGTNDIYIGNVPVTVDSLKDAITRMSIKAHNKGWKVTGATLIPRPADADPAKNSIRLDFNNWMRTTGIVDSYIDFDLALRDPTNPNSIKAEYYGDGVHPNAQGQAAMANAVDLSIFR
jgi:lysophospholipase L1-like esterase